MSQDTKQAMSIFERYLTLWVGLCIAGGILLGKIAPNLAGFLDRMAISVNGAPVVGVLIEVPVMLMLVKVCVKTQGWFQNTSMVSSSSPTDDSIMDNISDTR